MPWSHTRLLTRSLRRISAQRCGLDWWGFKLEAFDGIQQNVALVDQAQACAIVHSDSARDIQHLNQEAAKAMTAGRRMGMQISGASRAALDHA